MREINRRFRYGQMSTIFNVPLAIGILVFHCFLLPVFWYIALLHIVNMISAAIGGLVTWTSYSRKVWLYSDVYVVEEELSKGSLLLITLNKVSFHNRSLI